MTADRSEKMDLVLENRTKHIVLVIEDINNPHNINAVIRSCDCIGLQELHVLSRGNFGTSGGVARGASKWIDIKVHSLADDGLKKSVSSLRDEGYKICVTSPHKDGVSIGDLQIDQSKIALFFGNEVDGVSDQLMDFADEFVHVPMVGFTESFNVSVCAGISLYNLVDRLKQTQVQWGLSEQEKLDIKISWLRKSIRNREILEKDFLSTLVES